MSTDWPDALHAPDRARIQQALEEFWLLLAQLAESLAAREILLASERAATLRNLVLELMLALNGIRRPVQIRSLNRYLSQSQREALEKTLITPRPDSDAYIGQAVALVVIYRWYAPQLVDKFGLAYPAVAEQEVWQRISRLLPDWPLSVTTD